MCRKLVYDTDEKLYRPSGGDYLAPSSSDIEKDIGIFERYQNVINSTDGASRHRIEADKWRQTPAGIGAAAEYERRTQMPSARPMTSNGPNNGANVQAQIDAALGQTVSYASSRAATIRVGAQDAELRSQTASAVRTADEISAASRAQSYAQVQSTSQANLDRLAATQVNRNAVPSSTPLGATASNMTNQAAGPSATVLNPVRQSACEPIRQGMAADRIGC